MTDPRPGSFGDSFIDFAITVFGLAIIVMGALIVAGVIRP